MRGLIVGALVCAALLVGGATAWAGTIDQENDVAWTTILNNDASVLNWQQGIVAGLSGQLVGFEVHASKAGNADFYINLGLPWQTDSNAWSSNVSFAGAGWQYVDVSSAGINLKTGDGFVLGVQGVDGGLRLYATSGNPYGAGTLFLNGRSASNGVYDVQFRTHMFTPVPEPTSLVLFGLGAAGLALGRRRRKLV